MGGNIIPAAISPLSTLLDTPREPLEPPTKSTLGSVLISLIPRMGSKTKFWMTLTSSLSITSSERNFGRKLNLYHVEFSKDRNSGVRWDELPLVSFSTLKHLESWVKKSSGLRLFRSRTTGCNQGCLIPFRRKQLLKPLLVPA